MDISQVVTTSSNREFIRNKNVIVGTSSITDGELYLANQNLQIIRKEVKYIPSLFKIVDEILVNSIDHFINCILKSTIQHKTKTSFGDRYVNTIMVSIDDAGCINIANDGYGIPIVMMPGTGDTHDVPLGEALYLPEVLFTKERTGTNMGDDNTRITGGTNGIGATTICAFSRSIKLVIIDKDHIYIQQGTVGPNDTFTFARPHIKPNTSNSQCTSVAFTIDWVSTKFGKFSKPVNGLFTNYLIKRLIQTSLYTRHVTDVAKSLNLMPANICYPLIQFNDKMKFDIDFNNEEQINKTFRLLRSFTVSLVAKKAPTNPLSTKITLVVGINNINSDKEKYRYREISVINGVEVLHNPIANVIKGIISKTVKLHCEQNKMSTGNIKVKDYITIILVGCIPDPQWVGQVKEGLTLNKEFINNYNIKETCDSVKDRIGRIVYELVTNEKLKKRRNIDKKILNNNKTYSRCLSVEDGKRDKRITTNLFICEGGSASNLIASIRDKGKQINVNNTGSLATKGVISNVYHKMNWYSNDNFEFIKRDICEAVKCKLISTDDVEKNTFIQTFLAAMNLSEDKISDEALLNRINYDNVVCATDSDYDGWNISGLIFVLLSKWQVLFEQGRVKTLHLPIIRIIPIDLSARTEDQLRRRKTLSPEFIDSIKFWEFFTVGEYKEFISNNAIPSTHMAKFYKGLGTTENFFSYVIANNPEKYIYTIGWDKNAATNLELFYGKKRVDIIDGEPVVIRMSDKRKEILSTPVRSMTNSELNLYKNNKVICVSTFLHIFVKQYFLDNLQRKLLKIVDGLNNVGTKIFYALPSIFGEKTPEKRVSDVGPAIGSLTQYHHGEASINKSVQGHGQYYPGGVMLPILDTSGHWGTRYDGGEPGADGTGGAPRYIHCKLSNEFYRLLHPKADSIIYDYQEDEGKPIEPKYLLPVLPVIALTNYATTAHGWKITVWARSFRSVQSYVMAKIHLEMLENNLVANPNGVDPELIRNSLSKHVFDIEPRNYDKMPSRFVSEDPYEEFFISSGSYRIEETSNHKRIIIDSLPIGIWITEYINNINTKIGTKEKPGQLYNVVKSIESLSKDNVDICITMYDDWRDKIKLLPKEDKPWIIDSVDEIGLALYLYAKIYSEINILDEFGKVVTYKKYNDLIDDWFKLRLAYYVKRVKRIAAFTEVDILQAENKLRYLQNFTAMGLSGKSREEFDRILMDNGFDKFRNIVREGKTRCSKLNTVPNELLKDLYTKAVCTQSDHSPAIREDTDEELTRIIDELKHANIITGDLSYKYLRELRTGSVTTKGIQHAIADITSLKKVLAEHQEPGIEYKKFRREVADLNTYVMKKLYNS